MARPIGYPLTPRDTQVCGDSYLWSQTVTGEIPGTDFGRHLTAVIEPLYFRDGSTKLVPLFTSREDLAVETNVLYKRVTRARYLLRDHASDFTGPEVASLEGLLDDVDDDLRIADFHAKQIEPPALPGADQGDPGAHRADAQKYVTDALITLRCADYWIQRVILVKQAMRERPRELTVGPQQAKIFRPPLEGGAAPPSPRPPASSGRSYWPFIGAGLGALAVTGVTYYVVRR